jgi:hypothetical protein
LQLVRKGGSRQRQRNPLLRFNGEASSLLSELRYSVRRWCRQLHLLRYGRHKTVARERSTRQIDLPPADLLSRNRGDPVDGRSTRKKLDVGWLTEIQTRNLGPQPTTALAY